MSTNPPVTAMTSPTVQLESASEACSAASRWNSGPLRSPCGSRQRRLCSPRRAVAVCPSRTEGLVMRRPTARYWPGPSPGRSARPGLTPQVLTLTPRVTGIVADPYTDLTAFRGGRELEDAPHGFAATAAGAVSYPSPVARRRGCGDRRVEDPPHPPCADRAPGEVTATVPAATGSPGTPNLRTQSASCRAITSSVMRPTVSFVAPARRRLPETVRPNVFDISK